MPLLPSARRQWVQEEEVVIGSSNLSFSWPPKGYSNLTPDQKLLELEFAAMSLRRTKPGGGGPIDRTYLVDEFNFLALPGTAVLSPKKASHPAAKSRVYLYQALRNIARGLSSSQQDEEIISFLEAGQGSRNRDWDNIISVIEAAGIPLRLSE